MKKQYVLCFLNIFLIGCSTLLLEKPDTWWVSRNNECEPALNNMAFNDYLKFLHSESIKYTISTVGEKYGYYTVLTSNDSAGWSVWAKNGEDCNYGMEMFRTSMASKGQIDKGEWTPDLVKKWTAEYNFLFKTNISEKEFSNRVVKTIKVSKEKTSALKGK